MKKLLYLLLATLACLFSCQPPYPSALTKAEQCLMDSPDSTIYYLALLKDSFSSLPKEARMYYQLLNIGAEDKMYINHYSDTTMLDIVRFYEDYGNPEKLMLAYYYLGSTYRDMYDAPRAIHFYQKAADLGEKLPQQHELLSIIYGQIAELLAYQNVYDESLVATRKALNICKEHGDSLSYPSLLCHIARLWEDADKDSMLHYYHAAYQQALHNKDIEGGKPILVELGAVYFSLNKIEKAKNILLRLIQEEDKDVVALLNLGKIYYSENKLDSATYYLVESLKSGRFSQKSAAYRYLAKIKEQQNAPVEALKYANKAINYSDSARNITATEAVAKATALYNYQHTEQQNQQLQYENHRKLTIIYQIGIALLLCIVISIYIIKHLHHKKEIAIQQEKELRQLEEEKYKRSKTYIEDNKKRLAELEGQLHQAEAENDFAKQQLLSTQKALLELTNKQTILLQNKNELQEEHLEASPIYEFFHKGDGSNINAHDEEWEQLETTINTLYSGFTEKLYALCPSISEIELRICYLIKINVSPSAIAYILKRTPSAISMIRSRLYEKMYGRKGTPTLFDKSIGSL